MMERTTKLVEWRDKARKVSIGAIVASVVLGMGYAWFLSRVSETLLGVTGDSIADYPITYSYQSVLMNAQAAMMLFYISIGVALIAVSAWLASSLLVAYKES